MSASHDTFASRLLQLLNREPKTSQGTLAKSVGVTRQAINKYLNSPTLPDAHTLVRIADFFNVSTDWLLCRPGAIQAIEIDTATVCKTLGISQEAVERVKNVKSIKRAADMNLTPIRALDLLLRAQHLPYLCAAIAKNFMLVETSFDRSIENEKTYRELAEVESALKKKYGVNFYIVSGTRAIQKAREELEQEAKNVYTDILNVHPNSANGDFEKYSAFIDALLEEK